MRTWTARTIYYSLVYLMTTTTTTKKGLVSLDFHFKSGLLFWHSQGLSWNSLGFQGEGVKWHSLLGGDDMMYLLTHLCHQLALAAFICTVTFQAGRWEEWKHARRAQAYWESTLPGVSLAHLQVSFDCLVLLLWPGLLVDLHSAQKCRMEDWFM